MNRSSSRSMCTVRSGSSSRPGIRMPVNRSRCGTKGSRTAMDTTRNREFVRAISTGPTVRSITASGCSRFTV